MLQSSSDTYYIVRQTNAQNARVFFFRRAPSVLQFCQADCCVPDDMYQETVDALAQKG